MANTPDTTLVTGPNMQQVLIGKSLVTPTGGTQGELEAILATSTGGAVAATTITASAATLPIDGLAAAQGGSVTMTGGASSTAANAGGAVAIVGGTPGISGAGGAVNITSGAGGSTSGAAGAVAISVGSATSGNGAAVTISAGNGAGGTNAGGDVNLVPGDAVSTGAPGTFKVNGDANVIYATYYFTGTPAATDQVFFLATRPMMVVSMSEVHAVAAGGVSTLTVIKDTGTAAPGAGTSLHQSGSFDLNGTANTVQNGTVSTTVATKTLAAGNRLAVKFANLIQSSAGIVVSVGLTPL